MTKKEVIKRLKEIDIRDALQEDYDALYIAIKALEQCEVWDGIHGQVVAPKGTFDRIWEDAEKEEQEPKEWIPVSERLPKKNEWVLVTFKMANGENSIDIKRINRWNGQWEDEIDIAYSQSVIAWMPLPEPYKEREG